MTLSLSKTFFDVIMKFASIPFFRLPTSEEALSNSAGVVVNALSAACSFNNVFHSKLFRNLISTQFILLITGIENLRHGLILIPCIERNVVFLLISSACIPLRIEIGLAQQGNGSHQRARIILR